MLNKYDWIPDQAMAPHLLAGERVRNDEIGSRVKKGQA